MITVNELIEILEKLPDDQREEQIEKVELAWPEKDDLQVFVNRYPDGATIVIRN